MLPEARSVNDPKFRSVRRSGRCSWWRSAGSSGSSATTPRSTCRTAISPRASSFLWSTAGFGVNQALISYSEASSYGRALLVGFLNTLLVAGVGIVCATILGFLVGIMRLSRNWLVAKVAETYIEIVRNIPLLLQIFIWYATVLKPLPAPARAPQIGLPWPGGGFVIMAVVLGGGAWLLRGLYLRTQSVVDARRRDAAPVLRRLDGAAGSISEFGLSTINFVPLGIFLSNRGIMFPRPIPGEGAVDRAAALVLGIVCRWRSPPGRAAARNGPGSSSRRLRCRSADHRPAAARLPARQADATSSFPSSRGSTSGGGMTVIPEFLALRARAVDLYGVLHRRDRARRHPGGEPRPDRSGPCAGPAAGPDAQARGHSPGDAGDHSAAASQYLNLTKNSSLAVAIGYPDLVAMGGTMLNQTGQAIEIIGIWMVVYLSLIAADLGVHELVQLQHAAGGALR